VPMNAQYVLDTSRSVPAVSESRSSIRCVPWKRFYQKCSRLRTIKNRTLCASCIRCA